MSKSTKKSIKYMYISLFLFLYVNSMISIILLIYESGNYGLKWLKIVWMYDGEKVVARYDTPPYRNPE